MTGKPVAIIDIGSNSVRLVVYAGATRVPSILFNEKVMAGLGKSLASKGALSSGAQERALAEAYRRNNSGSYAEAAEFFGALLANGDGANRGEALVNQALQQSNLGNFTEADRLFAEADAAVAGKFINATMYKAGTLDSWERCERPCTGNSASFGTHCSQDIAAVPSKSAPKSAAGNEAI
mgnify:CR=1 FL=1